MNQPHPVLLPVIGGPMDGSDWPVNLRNVNQSFWTERHKYVLDHKRQAWVYDGKYPEKKGSDDE